MRRLSPTSLLGQGTNLDPTCSSEASPAETGLDQSTLSQPQIHEQGEIIIAVSYIIVVRFAMQHQHDNSHQRAVMRINSVQIHRKHKHLGQYLAHLGII